MPLNECRFLGLSPIEDRVFSGITAGESPRRVAEECGLPISAAKTLYERACKILSGRWGVPAHMVRDEARRAVGALMLVAAVITAMSGEDVMRARTTRLRTRRDHIERAA